ncbi:ferric-dicitrate binding protein FerR, regulates iron transport through sigma-19 [Algoriphagus locisalis]|uniref:Ferric-dicitrate binding protein FerR, regulates iron transport through sigma-19 n=1 Tax=Algoriphagus locisalis TaxID=305507 RepID=A0A1I7E471_9BACT|nr:FecR family protein [Algoriphagus locisalis]SFU18717.1 ferric-dicitrate binding protein FerR, regulates iron transport through sigma-19 [Algoriphagus locisalis]
MKFNPKSEYDFLKNEDFVLWVNHQKGQDTEYWHHWVQKNPDKAEYFHKAKAIVNSFQYSGDEKIDDLRLKTIREKLLEAYGNPRKNIAHLENKSTNSNWKKYKWLAAASVILFLVLGGLSWTYLKTDYSESANWVTVSTDRGERRNVMLPDGSSVILDSNSSLEYLTDFDRGRKVHLKGRAFFEVKKQNGETFEVSSDHFAVNVLGTSFDMNTDKDRGNGHVALVTGKVNVRMQNEEEVNLLPLDAAFINFESNQLRKGSFDEDQILGWRKNILKFKDESYKIVFERISNWYGVEFIYDKSLDLKGLYSATYSNQKLDDVLQGLSYASDLKFQIKSNLVYVTE